MNPIPHTLGLEPCLDFVNSRFTDHLGGGATHDRLARPEWQRWFVQRWGLAPVHGRPPVEDLRQARDTMRRVLDAWAAGKAPRPADLQRLDRWSAAAPMIRRFSGELEPVRRDWTWVLAEVINSAARLMRSGDPRRLKTCGNPGCTWMFLDESRNLSRRWCDPATCGNLITVREFRRRQRAASASS